MDSEKELFNYIVHNTELLKKLLTPIKEDAGELINVENLNEGFIDRAKWILISHLCFTLKLNVDSVVTFVDNMNLKELLK